jgi:hypothetical protein
MGLNCRLGGPELIDCTAPTALYFDLAGDSIIGSLEQKSRTLPATD